MSTPIGQTSKVESRSTVSSHRPAVPAFVAFAIGICLDRWMPLPLNIWLLLSVFGLIACLMLELRLIRRKPTSPFVSLESILILLVFVAVGGGRQHLFWNIKPQNDLSSYLTAEPHPVRLTGIIATPIEIFEAKAGPRIPPWMEVDRSTCHLQCESLEVAGDWKSVSGLARLNVSGHLVHVHVGDRVAIHGHLTAPGHPRNPGEMDYAEFLKRRGIGSTIRVEHPAAVQKLESQHGLPWKLARWRESLRDECQRIFSSTLNADERGLASSLLIGDRTMLNDEIAEQFAESGTMHLLAISGLNVGILAGLILTISRLLNLSPRTSAVVLLVTIFSYTFLTDHNPPVMRAGALATLAIFGVVRGQRIDRMNILAVCGLLLLVWHPTDLFDVGAQLSFLAVAAILWASGWSFLADTETDWSKIAAENSRWRRRLRAFGNYVFQIYLMTAAIWLTTLPLTMSIFHLVAPVGILLNVILIPLTTLVLAFGYLLVFGGLLFPAFADLLAIPFRWTLAPLQAAVAWGQRLPMGHFYVPAIPMWWLIGFYLLLFGVWQLSRFRAADLMSHASPEVSSRKLQRRTQALLLWIVAGLCLPFLPFSRDTLRCTFLSVGHGLASIIEFPSGQTVLYDAGTIGDGERASRVVENALWSYGVSRLDAIFISHADHDHFSGLFGLLEKFPVRTIFINQNFLDFEQSSVKELCELAATKGISIQLMQPEDKIELGNHGSFPTRIQVLNSQTSDTPRSDNANSLVLTVQAAGKTLLLTGDLEKEGLVDLLGLPPVPVDMMLSPHHGGKVANVLQLYDWARPQFAIVSSNREVLPHLAKIPETCTLLNTATSGAISCEIQKNGEIRISEYLK